MITPHSLPNLDFSVESTSGFCTHFASLYGIKLDNATYHTGTFTSRKLSLAGHIFSPPQSRGTVLLVHGLFDHTGMLRHLINVLLKEHYTVASMDLPGHGLSQGEAANIESFSLYGDAVSDFLSLCMGALPSPIHCIGHSTGCSALLEHFHAAPETDSKGRVVLIAPLIRTAGWRALNAAYLIAGKAFHRLPRLFVNPTHDPCFVSFQKKDPLQTRTFRVNWFRALREWNRRLEMRGLIRCEAAVVQGTDDTVVDWRYNIRYLRKKLLRCTVQLVEGGKHHLINETEPFRCNAFRNVFGYLKS
ncbi:MAG: alpha/beta hydrolase [Chitinispirillaceae bacterium]